MPEDRITLTIIVHPRAYLPLMQGQDGWAFEVHAADGRELGTYQTVFEIGQALRELWVLATQQQGPAE